MTRAWWRGGRSNSLPGLSSARTWKPGLEPLEDRCLPSFLAPSFLYTGNSSPTGLLVVDVNRDGIPDLLTSASAGTVGVQLGNGDGTFRTPLISAAGYNAHGPVVADFNGDGIPDVALRTDNVAVLLGNGDGTFRPGNPVNIGALPLSLAVGDLNGDGVPDLVATCFPPGGPTTVVVLLGNGDGTFRALPLVVPGGFYPGGVGVGDLNADGNPDLAVVAGNSIDVFLGNGDGTFRTPVSYPTLADSTPPAIVDVNGDGVPDLVTLYGNSSLVAILPGNGDGTFRPYYTVGTGAYVAALAVADLNGDGIPDLVTGGGGSFFSNGAVRVLIGNGDGSFQSPTPYTAAGGIQALAVADVNGDGKADCVALDSYAIGILFGNGDGTLRTVTSLSVGSRPQSAAVADLNGDGIPDLAVPTNESNGTVSVLLGNGDGSFRPAVHYPAGAFPEVVRVADLNGDGIPDLAVPNSSTNRVSVLLGNGDGTFRAPLSFLTGFEPLDLAVMDLNADGKADVVTADYRSGTVSVLLGNGDGSFQAPTLYASGAFPESVTVGDVNGDGIPDLAVANSGTYSYYQDATITVFLGNGDGSFKPAVPFFAGPGPRAVVMADLNGDGKPDLAAADDASGGGGVAVLLGNGDGTFRMPTFFAGLGPSSLAVGDLNGDGIPDLVSSTTFGPVSVLLGNGDGFFRPSLDYYAGVHVYSVAVGDVNGDGAPDILAANFDSSSVTVLFNAADWHSPGTLRASSPALRNATRAQPLVWSPDMLDSVRGGTSLVGALLLPAPSPGLSSGETNRFPEEGYDSRTVSEAETSSQGVWLERRAQPPLGDVESRLVSGPLESIPCIYGLSVSAPAMGLLE